MNQKRGLNRLSKLPEDGDPWAPYNVLTETRSKRKTPTEPRWAKQ